MADQTTKPENDCNKTFAVTTDPRVAKVLQWFDDALRNCPVDGWKEIKTVARGGSIMVEIHWTYKFRDEQDGG